MKLFYSKGACSLAIRITIHELGIPCEFEAVDLKSKKTETGKDFLNINPKGYVPVLITDHNEILTENTVIHQYLADEYHATQLIPSIGTFNRYRVLEWVNYVSTELHKGCGALFNPNVPLEIKESVFIPLLKKKLDFVEQQLSKNTYLSGDYFTPADAYLFVVLRWLPLFKVDLSQWKILSEYFSRLYKRNSIVNALEEEHISVK